MRWVWLVLVVVAQVALAADTEAEKPVVWYYHGKVQLGSHQSNVNYYRVERGAGYSGNFKDAPDAFIFAQEPFGKRKFSSWFAGYRKVGDLGYCGLYPEQPEESDFKQLYSRAGLKDAPLISVTKEASWGSSPGRVKAAVIRNNLDYKSENWGSKPTSAGDREKLIRALFTECKLLPWELFSPLLFKGDLTEAAKNFQPGSSVNPAPTPATPGPKPNVPEGSLDEAYDTLVNVYVEQRNSQLKLQQDYDAEKDRHTAEVSEKQAENTNLQRQIDETKKAEFWWPRSLWDFTAPLALLGLLGLYPLYFRRLAANTPALDSASANHPTGRSAGSPDTARGIQGPPLDKSAPAGADSSERTVVIPATASSAACLATGEIAAFNIQWLATVAVLSEKIDQVLTHFSQGESDAGRKLASALKSLEDIHGDVRYCSGALCNQRRVLEGVIDELSGYVASIIRESVNSSIGKNAENVMGGNTSLGDRIDHQVRDLAGALSDLCQLDASGTPVAAGTTSPLELRPGQIELRRQVSKCLVTVPKFSEALILLGRNAITLVQHLHLAAKDLTRIRGERNTLRENLTNALENLRLEKEKAEQLSRDNESLTSQNSQSTARIEALQADVAKNMELVRSHLRDVEDDLIRTGYLAIQSRLDDQANQDERDRRQKLNEAEKQARDDAVRQPELRAYVQRLIGLRGYLATDEARAFPHAQAAGLDEVLRRLAERSDFMRLYQAENLEEALLGQWDYYLQRIYRAALLVDSYWRDRAAPELRARLNACIVIADCVLAGQHIVPHRLELPVSREWVAERQSWVGEQSGQGFERALDKDQQFREQIMDRSRREWVFCDVATWGYDISDPAGHRVGAKSILVPKNPSSTWP